MGKDHGWPTDENGQCEASTKKMSYFKMEIIDKTVLMPNRCKNPPLEGEAFCWIHLPADRKRELNARRFGAAQ